MSKIGVSESLIENDLGCGPFQWLLVTFVYWLPAIPLLSGSMMMTFGSYNPGWKCLDSNNHSFSYTNFNASPFKTRSPTMENNITIAFEHNNTDYQDESCTVFKECSHVEFNSEASTIVSEWGLICSKARVPSVIISVQMVGMFVSSMISGYLTDKIGRKISFYGFLFLSAVINFISIFSVSWVMFAVLRFFFGFVIAGLVASHFLYSSEFLPKKWRGPFSGSPTWPVSGICFAVIVMLLKDWKIFLKVMCIMSILCCLPAFWVPESLRWLEVKNKPDKFRKAAAKIANVNRTHNLSRIESSMFLAQNNNTEYHARKNDKYAFLQLFRPGYKAYSLIFAFLWFSISIVITSISFGINVLGGNFYINLIVLNAMSLPFTVFPVVAPNAIGRKRTLLVCFVWITTCLVAAICFESFSEGKLKDVGVLLVLTCAVAGVESAQSTLTLVTIEVYPTVARGLGLSWGYLMIRLGAILAPFLIPSGADTVYLWYSVMAALGLLSSCLVMWLPETKGKPLKETFDTPTPV